MRVFDFFRHADINQGVNEYRIVPGALLLDVRTAGEYNRGHIPGSVNFPLRLIYQAEKLTGKDTPLFVYCQSGARSRQAAAALSKMGFHRVKNIGGISNYTGKVEA